MVKPVEPTTIAGAAATGDRRKTLVAMRDKLARDMDQAPPAVVAQIAGRLSALLSELDSLPSALEDPLAAARAAREDRLATANGGRPAKRQTRQRRA